MMGRNLPPRGEKRRYELERLELGEEENAGLGERPLQATVLNP